MGMMSMVGLVGALVLAFTLFLPFFFVYAFGVYAQRGGPPVKQLGAQTVTTMLTTVSFQIILMGLVMLLVNVIEDGRGRVTKQALALVSGGLVSGLLPFILYRKVRQVGAAYDVGRKAIGINAMVTGIVTTMLTLVFFVALFNGAKVLSLAAGLAVYAIASTLLLLRVAGSNGAAAGGNAPTATT